MYASISLNSSYDKKCFRFVEKSEYTFVFHNFFFSKNRAVYEVMSKNVMEPERPQMVTKYGAYALHAG
jgi:hypothetical protein